jgi:hypothetical protein
MSPMSLRSAFAPARSIGRPVMLLLDTWWRSAVE